jgi:hypothetical protein
MKRQTSYSTAGLATNSAATSATLILVKNASPIPVPISKTLLWETSRKGIVSSAKI